jgi:hypothetical protein
MPLALIVDDIRDIWEPLPPPYTSAAQRQVISVSKFNYFDEAAHQKLNQQTLETCTSGLEMLRVAEIVTRVHRRLFEQIDNALWPRTDGHVTLQAPLNMTNPMESYQRTMPAAPWSERLLEQVKNEVPEAVPVPVGPIPLPLPTNLALLQQQGGIPQLTLPSLPPQPQQRPQQLPAHQQAPAPGAHAALPWTAGIGDGGAAAPLTAANKDTATSNDAFLQMWKSAIIGNKRPRDDTGVGGDAAGDASRDGLGLEGGPTEQRVYAEEAVNGAPPRGLPRQRMVNLLPSDAVVALSLRALRRGDHLVYVCTQQEYGSADHEWRVVAKYQTTTLDGDGVLQRAGEDGTLEAAKEAAAAAMLKALGEDWKPTDASTFESLHAAGGGISAAADRERAMPPRGAVDAQQLPMSYQGGGLATSSMLGQQQQQQQQQYRRPANAVTGAATTTTTATTAVHPGARSAPVGTTSGAQARRRQASASQGVTSYGMITRMNAIATLRHHFSTGKEMGGNLQFVAVGKRGPDGMVRRRVVVTRQNGEVMQSEGEEKRELWADQVAALHLLQRLGYTVDWRKPPPVRR